MLNRAIENVRFRKNYSRHILYAFIAACMIHLFTFLFFPDFEIAPYAILEKEPVEGIRVEAYKLPEKPDEIEQPVFPVAASSPDEAMDASLVPVNAPSDISGLPPIHTTPEVKADNFIPFSRKPVLIHSVTPNYPPLPRSGGIEGEIILKVLIDEKGKVIDVTVLSSDATRSLIEAAVEAAMQFRFRPALQGNRPVKSAVRIPVRFRLR